MEYVTENAQETKKLGKKIGNYIKGRADVLKKGAFVVALCGDLGSGKTTFTKGVAKSLGVKRRIISPTFILIRRYVCGGGVESFYHIDLYRIEGKIKNQLREIGFDEILKSKRSVVLVEWADKGKSIFPKDTVWVKFEYISENTRKIKITGLM